MVLCFHPDSTWRAWNFYFLLHFILQLKSYFGSHGVSSWCHLALSLERMPSDQAIQFFHLNYKVVSVKRTDHNEVKSNSRDAKNALGQGRSSYGVIIRISAVSHSQMITGRPREVHLPLSTLLASKFIKASMTDTSLIWHRDLVTFDEPWWPSDLELGGGLRRPFKGCLTFLEVIVNSRWNWRRWW